MRAVHRQCLVGHVPSATTWQGPTYRPTASYTMKPAVASDSNKQALCGPTGLPQAKRERGEPGALHDVRRGWRALRCQLENWNRIAGY
jgi:hypothetical protein